MHFSPGQRETYNNYWSKLYLRILLPPVILRSVHDIRKILLLFSLIVLLSKDLSWDGANCTVMCTSQYPSPLVAAMVREGQGIEQPISLTPNPFPHPLHIRVGGRRRGCLTPLSPLTMALAKGVGSTNWYTRLYCTYLLVISKHMIKENKDCLQIFRKE